MALYIFALILFAILGIVVIQHPQLSGVGGVGLYAGLESARPCLANLPGEERGD